MAKKETNSRLPRNFHKTFVPERKYINAMLRFAASGQSADAMGISAATGIPTGKSSGKVPAILDYCRGMGLIRLSNGTERSAIKYPELTHFGRIVLFEDPFLKCEVTQWIAHLNLCSPITGADVWYHSFFTGAQSLGRNFSREQLEEYLGLIYKVETRSLIGPLIGMYDDDASFKTCGAIRESKGQIKKSSAPIKDDLGRGYGAWMLQLCANHFPKQQQISLNELDKLAGWKTIPGWLGTEASLVLELLERKAIVTVDRHMDPWLLQIKMNLDDAWRKIYNDII